MMPKPGAKKPRAKEEGEAGGPTWPVDVFLQTKEKKLQIYFFRFSSICCLVIQKIESVTSASASASKNGTTSNFVPVRNWLKFGDK